MPAATAPSPCEASARQVALPMPPAPPVTAVLPRVVRQA
jgi:hypothetical protein